MRYALLDVSNNIVNYRDFSDAPPILAKEKGLHWVASPEVTAPIPELSPEEQLAIEVAEKTAHMQQIALEALPDILAYIAAKTDAPQILKDKEAEATVERDKLANMKTKP